MKQLLIALLIPVLLTACGTATPASTPEPAGTDDSLSIPTVRTTPVATFTPVPPPTETPLPTPSAQVITPDNLNLLRAVRDLGRHPMAIYGVAVSADAQLVASASADGRVRVFDTVTGAQLYELAAQ